jgi:hypothetical protein
MEYKPYLYLSDFQREHGKNRCCNTVNQTHGNFLGESIANKNGWHIRNQQT